MGGPIWMMFGVGMPDIRLYIQCYVIKEVIPPDEILMGPFVGIHMGCDPYTLEPRVFKSLEGQIKHLISDFIIRRCV